MSYWLLKTEPQDFSWSDMVRSNITVWDNVLNYQAQGYLRLMKSNDLAFFYHSGIEKSIIGIVSIYKEFYCFNKNDKFGVVDVKIHTKLKKAVHLKDIKLETNLKNLIMLRQPRLSVSPITEKEWNSILEISETSL
ncbi:EVE domain-containing protein [Ehrlichia ruminantium]|uniref:EVE domain-containing protein n=1 Tax=Ehrlichia ruminantium (strain Welgevonden) TaxID=254945 RepID=A0A0H3M732_EHRRW|nr:EVE domain-containing protein [Ehrlichia ruminantium]KYW98421.1 ubiquinol-cytochrome C reductase [Ehrlichia ruminantium]QLK50968.1 EVE domain-containing protein [Ehrlichia ruminantium]QLK51890.1 EVE domain-containing protein [Ehrlichia ruminantium]QLK53731.1 EVE domain-containing protein [Ehrlichia ruminantium]QLK55567.1 EVE domain-containing protein [Ehrlichia ruminantium]